MIFLFSRMKTFCIKLFKCKHHAAFPLVLHGKIAVICIKESYFTVYIHRYIHE